MKKLALLSVTALLLASSVFAPAAQAQGPGDIDIQSVTLEPNGPWTITGTIQCTEGGSYSLQAGIVVGFNPEKKHLKNKKPISLTATEDFGDCVTTGPQSFTTFLVPIPVTEKDKLWVAAQGRVCGLSPEGEFTCNTGEFISERVK